MSFSTSGFSTISPSRSKCSSSRNGCPRSHILLDTTVHPSGEFAIYLKWEEPLDIRVAADEGMVALPTKPGVELMLRHLKFNSWIEIPMRTGELPIDYLTRRRVSWLIKV
jgi:hypothetical protein